jgi:hypothetical protein
MHPKIQVIITVLSFFLQPPPNMNFDGINQLVDAKPLMMKYSIILFFPYELVEAKKKIV